MARQSGLIKLKGTLDNVNFYKTKDGNLARMKTSVDAKRIANDPAFERTRENGKEFGSSAASGKLLRDAVRPMSMNASDGRVTARMTKVMTVIKNLDAVNDRGKRVVSQGIQDPEGVAALKGFDFNKEALLGSILYKPFTVDPASGEIVIPNLVPQMDISWPQGATHIQLSCGFVGVDFDTNEKDLQISQMVNLPIDPTATTVTLTPAGAPAVATTKLFLLKIEFFQEVNGNQYTLKNGAYNALKVVEVA
ncbi:MAG: hypothetical protein K9G36_09645 [Crocinitomicaceae bacterium]|nr:hypothetical protein [Crocinitomicaceae bacterium]MCF8435088.1 hypothetical protein [Crocinitomicaceae bacterium]